MKATGGAVWRNVMAASHQELKSTPHGRRFSELISRAAAASQEWIAKGGLSRRATLGNLAPHRHPPSRRSTDVAD